jgi:hypothetical protein
VLVQQHERRMWRVFPLRGRRGGVGSTGRDLSVMAVPGLDPGIGPAFPIRKSVAPQSIGITGTRLVMTSEGYGTLAILRNA